MTDPQAATSAPTPALGSPPGTGPSEAHPQAPVRHRWWLQGLAFVTVLSMFVLIGIGGHVTSTGSGLAVPDWPTTFGYDMITAPLDVWWHDIGTRVEHAHRLKGTVVGLLTIALAFALLFYNFPRKWLVWTGFGLLGGVIVQGILGGTRVTETSYLLAFFHGVFGQVLFAATVLIACATGRTWLRLAPRLVEKARQPRWARRMRALAIGVIVILVVQLVLGAAVRHAGAGRAIPDFPLSYGQVIPPMSVEDVKATVLAWDEKHPDEPVWKPHNRVDERVTAGEIPPDQAEAALWPMMQQQIHLQFTHRVFAYVVVGAILFLVGWLVVRAPGQGELVAPTMWLGVLILLQFLLGASTVWTERSPVIATAHQATGAALLAIATWLAIRVTLVVGQPEEHDRAVDAASGSSEPAKPATPVGPAPAVPRVKGVSA